MWCMKKQAAQVSFVVQCCDDDANDLPVVSTTRQINSWIPTRRQVQDRSPSVICKPYRALRRPGLRTKVFQEVLTDRAFLDTQNVSDGAHNGGYAVSICRRPLKSSYFNFHVWPKAQHFWYSKLTNIYFGRYLLTAESNGPNLRSMPLTQSLTLISGALFRFPIFQIK